MKILGIVAEYNPFHNGHLAHIQESKKLIARETATVCVMSGDFVQRGEAAIFSKYSRAEAAVKSGADLVLELPLPWSLSSAEGFSQGAVGLLGQLGCVDYLSFGSESGDLAVLNSLATALLDPAMDDEIREELKSGVSYPQARQRALAKTIGSLAEQLETPNNILAVEYLKAIYKQRLRIEPITIARIGAGHDEAGGSASDLRSMLAAEKSIKHYVPKPAYEIFEREMQQGRGPVLMDELERAIISRFRMMDEEDFAELPDDSEGLGNRLFAAAREESTLDGIIAAAKSKRYPLSRIRRMCMCLALGIKKGQADGPVPYARVLAANQIGREVLNKISEKSSIPLITKPAAVKDFSDECREIFELGSREHDLYVLAFSALEERRGGGDYRATPKML